MNTKLFLGTAVIALIVGGVFTYASLHVARAPAPTPSEESAPGVSEGLASETAAQSAGYDRGNAHENENENAYDSENENRNENDSENEGESEGKKNETGAADAPMSPAAVPAPPPAPLVPPAPASTPVPASVPTKSTYSLADIAAHKSASSCYMAIRGKVYDVTKYIGKHPGGNTILKGCGKDATDMFEGVRGHLKQKTLDLLPGFYKGELQG